jgi:CDP-4-dehydro-6-deoxyglucose reductase|tara:strand:- start:434 stop:1522 length:1089 start_codon:yes stop_codon:yes gene_type:complete
MNIYKYLWFFGQKPVDSTATLYPSNKKVFVKSNQSLLAAALEQGLDWPHDCKFGSCTSCKAKLVKGKIKPTSDYSQVLTKEELSNDYFLACQARLTMDSEIEIELGDLVRAPSGKCNAYITSAEMLTGDIMKITVETEEVVEHNGLPGMWAELSIEGLDRPRSYSFASAPKNENPKEFTFFIRKVPGGKFTEWLFNKNRDIKQCITISGPFGSFYLREKNSPIICIAGGSGLAPIKSLLEGGVLDQVKRDVVFLFGARTQDDLYCMQELEDIKQKWNKEHKFEFIPVLNMEPEDSNWKGGRGFVTDYFEENYIKKNNVDISNWQGYLCGPPPMVDAACQLLEKHGIKTDQIFYDKFTDSSNL